MNKFLLWSGIAVLAITSCAKDQTKEVNNGHEIGFRAATTKATELYYSDLTSFYCTAIDANDDNFFTNVGFLRSGIYFSSSPAYYWPADGSTLKFWAYYPSDEAMGAEASINAAEQLIKGFKPAEKWEDQIDFITAKAEGSKADEANGVPLNFEHQLAQISISAKNQNSEYVYKVYGFRIVNALTNGTYNFANDSWAFDAANPEKATYATMLEEPVTLTTYNTELTRKRVQLSEDSYDYVYNTSMIIPQALTAWDPETDESNTAKGAYLSLAIQITTKSGDLIFPETGEYGYVATPIDTDLKSGYNHFYYLDFTKGAGYNDPEFGGTGSALGENIKFTVKVNPWNEPEQGEILRRQLEGSWKANHVTVTNIYPDEVPANYRQEDITYTDPERVKQYFNGNGFYEFTVDNNYIIHMTTPDGLKTESSMTVDNDGNIYLEAFKDPSNASGYEVIPVIQEVNDAEHTAITYIDNQRNGTWYEYDDDNNQIRHDYSYIRRQTFYYDKF